MRLLILDLDETLLHSTLPHEPRHASLPTYEIGAYRTQFRPGLQRFLLDAQLLDWCLAIWTAAGSTYAELALNALREHTRLDPRFEFVFTRERCTPPPAFDPHRAPLKDLKKAFRHGWRKETTLILDDRPDGIRRQRGNLLTIHPWEGDPNDTHLQRATRALERLATVLDVRCSAKVG